MLLKDLGHVNTNHWTDFTRHCMYSHIYIHWKDVLHDTKYTILNKFFLEIDALRDIHSLNNHEKTYVNMR